MQSTDTPAVLTLPSAKDIWQQKPLDFNSETKMYLLKGIVCYVHNDMKMWVPQVIYQMVRWDKTAVLRMTMDLLALLVVPHISKRIATEALFSSISVNLK